MLVALFGRTRDLPSTLDSSLSLPKMDESTRSTLFAVPRRSSTDDYAAYVPPDAAALEHGRSDADAARPSSSCRPLDIAGSGSSPAARRLPSLGRFSPLRKTADVGEETPDRPRHHSDAGSPQRPTALAEIPDTISV